MAKFVLILAGLLGATAVGLGAFGAHALASSFTAREERLWSLASHYALVHAAVLLAIGAWLQATPESAAAFGVQAMVASFAVGTALFAGSLYALALGAPRSLGAATPIGGVLLIVGWALVAWRGSP